MNGLTDDKKRSVVPNVCVCVCSEAGKLGSLGCGQLFGDHVTRWLHVLRHVVLQRIDRAVQLDNVRVIHAFKRFAVETSSKLSKISITLY